MATEADKRAQAKINELKIGERIPGFEGYYRAHDGSIRKKNTNPKITFTKGKPQVKKGVKLTRGQKRKLKEKLNGETVRGDD